MKISAYLRGSPPVMHDIVAGGGPYLKVHAMEFGDAMYAANLCGSMAEQRSGRFAMSTQVYTQVIENLLASRGELLNKYLVPRG